MKTPTIPHNAPYSDNQRAWLSGFFAGMRNHILQNADSESHSEARIINILYGSQTGNSESVAGDVSAAAKKHGLLPVVKGMDEIDSDALSKMNYLLIVTSTYGEGEMPDNAQLLWDQMSADNAPTMENTRFSILALGDSSYDKFCQAGIDWDDRLVALGANRILDRADYDIGMDAIAENWMNSVISMMAEGTELIITDSQAGDDDNKPKYNHKNPFYSKMMVNRLLTKGESSKETRHYELSLEGSELTYEAGDAVNVIAENCLELVADIVKAIGCAGDEDEPVHGELMPLSEALRTHFEIKLPSKQLVQEIANRSGDQELNKLLEFGNNYKLADYLWGRDTLDLLLKFPTVEFSAAEFISFLKPLQHRAYSISSSGKMYPESVHLTVASVRYDAHNRNHKGVCSTYMADLVNDDTMVKIFFAPNKSFRVPEDDTLPIIMVGPGTGIAPFRAFLQERQFRKATGKNWLIFGDRNSATDFIYQDEIEVLQSSGVLTRLDLAFSRDQQEKIYVQDRMRENSAELFSWLEQGGSFFVCGDANYMAKDVDKALHEIIEEQGSKTVEQAIDYVNHLKKEKRYVRDVY